MKNIIVGIDGTIYYANHLVPGARPALRRFIDQGYDIFIMSRRLEYMSVEQLSTWLDSHGIPWVDIIGNGELPSYSHALIDDDPVKLVWADKATTIKHLILFDRPWNRKIEGRFERAKNWRQIKEIIG